MKKTKTSKTFKIFRKIKKLEGQRWFIWTLVVIVIGLNSLSLYIYSTVLADDSSIVGLPPVTLLTHPRPSVSTTRLAGTTWTAQDSQVNASIQLLTTKQNDPKHLAYDYRIMADSRAQEIGYWQISGNQITPKTTRVLVKAQQIKKMIVTGNSMWVYTANSITSSLFVRAATITPATPAK